MPLKSNYSEKVTKMTLAFVSALALGTGLTLGETASAQEEVDESVSNVAVEESIQEAVVQVEYEAELPEPIEESSEVAEVAPVEEVVEEDAAESSDEQETVVEEDKKDTSLADSNEKEDAKQETPQSEKKEKSETIPVVEVKEQKENTVTSEELREAGVFSLSGVELNRKGRQRTVVYINGEAVEVEVELDNEVYASGVLTNTTRVGRIWYVDPNTKRSYDELYIQTINGQVVFCVEPMTTYNGGTTYTGETLKAGTSLKNTYSFNGSAGTPVTLSSDTIAKAQQIFQYGFVEGGKTAKAYGFSQMMIWETLNGTKPLYTDGWMAGKQSEYEKFKADVNSKMLKSTSANFGVSSLTFKPGESKTVTDVNGVISKLNVPTTYQGYKITRNGNSLTITAPSTYTDERAELGLSGSIGSGDNILYRRTGKQTFAYFGGAINLLGNLDLRMTTPEPVVEPIKITSEASGFTGKKVIDPFKVNTLSDKVNFENLVVGKTYQVQTKIVEHGDINKVIAEFSTDHVSKAANESINLTRQVNGRDLIGKKVTWVHTLLESGTKVADHLDPSNTAQTVEFTNPNITTVATSKDGKKLLLPAPGQEVLEVAKISGLIVGNKYKVKVEGRNVADGSVIVPSHMESFTADSDTKEFTFNFTVDGSKLAGKQLTFVEYLYGENESGEDEEITNHNTDHKEKDQTVEIAENPKIKTLATGSNGKHLVSPLKQNLLTEVVELTGLVPGVEYTVKVQGHRLGDKGKIEGAAKEETFVADSENKKLTYTFEVNGHELKGQGVTFAEELFALGVLLADHNKSYDIEEQTVKVSDPSITTKATTQDGKKLLVPAPSQDILEVAKISGLVVGQEYKVRVQGFIVEDKNPLAETFKEETFVADSDTKEFKFNFKVDTSKLAGKNISFVEHLFTRTEGGEFEETTDHNTDFEEQDQTVTVSDPNITTLATSKDGKKTLNPLGNQEVVEVAKISGLVVGQEYKVRVQGFIVEDKNPLAETFKEETFVADSDTKEFKFSFMVDGAKLAGKNLSFVEHLFARNTKGEFDEVENHNTGFEEQDQTVKFNEMPNITTLATGHILDKHIYALPNQKVIEVAKLTGLTVGEEYRVNVQGWLVGQDGKATKFEGTNAEETFVADSTTKEFTFTFTVDGSKFVGNRLSFVEQLFTRNTKGEFDKVTDHNTNLDVEDQTVTFRETPQITTLATNKDGGKEILAAPGQTILEVAKLSGLTVGNHYRMTVQGYVVDKDGKDAKELEGTRHVEEFEATATEMEFKYEFVVDGTNLVGKTIAFSETLDEKNKEGEYERVSDHNVDFSEESQSVKVVPVPEVPTVPSTPNQPTIVKTADGMLSGLLASAGSLVAGLGMVFRKKKKD